MFASTTFSHGLRIHCANLPELLRITIIFKVLFGKTRICLLYTSIAEQSDVLYRILPYTGLTTTVDVRHALASLPIWEAYLARMTGIHPAIIAHSVLPLVLIPVTYLLYYLIGRRLFGKENRRLAVFMILVSVPVSYTHLDVYKRQHPEWYRGTGQHFQNQD